jgi:hypothetical protein
MVNCITELAQCYCDSTVAGLSSSPRFSPSSKARLTERDLGRFAGGTLFDAIGRAVCKAGCLPRKELYEAWEMARRVRRLFRGGRVVDLGAGHGLLAQVLLLLDGTSPRAAAVDRALAPSAGKLHEALVEVWPGLAGRVDFLAQPMEEVALGPDDLVVSSHACGRLSDLVIDRALAAGARVAVLPCCHDLDTCDTGNLDGWLDGALAVDVTRAVRMRERGYRVWTLAIPAAITPKNRLLAGAPRTPRTSP